MCNSYNEYYVLYSYYIGYICTCFILKIIVNCIVFVIMEIELRKEIYRVVMDYFNRFVYYILFEKLILYL